MKSTPFWNYWSPAERRIFLVLAGLFALVLAAALVSFFVHPWPVFSWQQLQELQTQEIPVFSFERGNMEFTVPAENFILFERWMANPFEPNLVALDVYFFFFSAGLIVVLSTISLLPRFWFYVGAGLAVFLISSLRWEALLLGGLGNQIPVIGITILFVTILLYFQFFQTASTYWTRTITFALAIVLIALIVSFTSQTNQPLRFLAVNTLPAALVLLVAFILMTAHQLMASFVTLATQSTKTHGLRNYLIISIIYLLNLWLAYWDRIGWLDWDYTIPGLALLFISGALTLWNIRQRAPLYEGITSREEFFTLFIWAFGTMAMATAGYFIASANDIVVLTLGDLIIYTHLGYGMMFLIYVGSNFLGVFEKNLPVQKVLYKPTSMPYFTYRFAGLIVTLAFIFYNTWMTPVNHFISGYYTALGDLHFYEPTPKAYNFYRRGHFEALYNQHASTALALFEGSNGNYQKQLAYSVDANRFLPTEFTLLNTDHLYLLSGRAYEDIQLLRKAKSIFPSSGVIRNNLGLAYTRVGMADSAAYYFKAAAGDRRTRNSASLNMLGLVTRNNLKDPVDSISVYLSSAAASVRSNAIALANRRGKALETRIVLPADSVLDLFNAALLGNYLTNQIARPDTAFISRCIALARVNQNQPFKSMILQAAAGACYASGQVNRAVLLLQEVIFSGNNQGPNNYTLGLWAMDQHKHDVALNHFQYALNYKSAPAALANAVSLAEDGRLNEALVAWDTISHRKDTALNSQAESMKRVLAAPASWFVDLSPLERLYYVLYRIPLRDTILFQQLVRQIPDEDLQAKAYLHRARKYFSQDEIGLASRHFNRLQGLHLTDTRLFVDIKYFELRILAAQHRLSDLQTIVDQGILFGPFRQTERVYFEALHQKETGDTAAAARSFRWLAANNSYFDEAVVDAAMYFGADEKKSYTILSEALQVNPHSAKILKAYIPIALSRGFDAYAAGALESLREIISPEALRKYIIENQLTGLLSQ
ncbi:MAG: hypothetical protein SH819_02240 [Cytophagales bacterium]|nr:hypothetical protein [Cytophagales bacterium]